METYDPASMSGLAGSGIQWYLQNSTRAPTYASGLTPEQLQQLLATKYGQLTQNGFTYVADGAAQGLDGEMDAGGFRVFPEGTAAEENQIYSQYNLDGSFRRDEKNPDLSWTKEDTMDLMTAVIAAATMGTALPAMMGAGAAGTGAGAAGLSAADAFALSDAVYSGSTLSAGGGGLGTAGLGAAGGGLSGAGGGGAEAFALGDSVYGGSTLSASGGGAGLGAAGGGAAGGGSGSAADAFALSDSVYGGSSLSAGGGGTGIAGVGSTGAGSAGSTGGGQGSALVKSIASATGLSEGVVQGLLTAGGGLLSGFGGGTGGGESGGGGGSQRMDPRMDQFIYGGGPNNNAGLLNHVNWQLNQDRAPENIAIANAYKTRGQGLLGQPIAGNGFNLLTGRG